MKVRVNVQTPQMTLDEVFSGADAEAVVRAMQKSAAGRLSFLLRAFVNAMSPLQFAQEVVRRYNEAMKKDIPAPTSCQEFLERGQTEGIAQILEP
jgi:hypothetical protein